MKDGTAAQWGQDRLPTDLLDDGVRADSTNAHATAATRQQQHIGIRYTATLIQRSVTPLLNLRLKHVYTAMTAAAFTMPRVVDAAQGLAARHLHLFEHIPVAHRTGAIARAVRRIKHPALPPEFTETAFCVAFSGFPFGPEKGKMCGRTTCPCDSRAPETVEHTFHTCHRSMRIWELVLSSWRDVTGESKIKPTDGLVVLFGDRSGTWLDEAEQAQFAGLEEPFAVLHKITLHTILQERNRDAAPKAKQRRSPTVLFQKIQHVVQRVASHRWRQARRQQQFDHGDAVTAFRKRWEAPGIAVIAADEQSITIILFMRKAVRDQWHRSPKGTGHYRSQQYAPPANLPPLTISIFSDGSALTRKIGQPAPPRATAWLQLKAPALMP